MAARGSKSAQQSRAQAERSRVYAARKSWHEGRIARRRRDNIIAVLVGAVIVIAAIASQVIHAEVTAPAPSPTSSVAPVDQPTTEPTPEPTVAETPAG